MTLLRKKTKNSIVQIQSVERKKLYKIEKEGFMHPAAKEIKNQRFFFTDAPVLNWFNIMQNPSNFMFPAHVTSPNSSGFKMGADTRFVYLFPFCV